MQRLLASLRAQTRLTDPRVEEAMLKTDRANYCPGSSADAYIDRPMSIGCGATISAPHMHAIALECLKDHLVEGAMVLDVGSGSGYLTACMAQMVGTSGKVFGVEHIESLVNWSLENLKKDCPELLESGRIEIHRGDGRVGLEKYGPYDVIHVGAAAEKIPEKLVEQLREGGKMVLPLGSKGGSQNFLRVAKLPGGGIETETILGVIYVPLTDAKSQLADT